jgi:tungstate transport system permease protein
MTLVWQGLLDALGLLAARDPGTLRVAGLSLAVSGLATLLAALVGVPLGAALALRRLPGGRLLAGLVNTGMGLPPVVVGLGVSILLWRSGPFGPLALLYTPAAMVAAQFIVAMPLAAGLTRSALGLVDADLVGALRADGAGEWRVAWELLRAARAQVVVAVAAAFGRAISEVGASLMVGGNILGQTRILTTAITLETGRGDFARAIALGLLLLALAFLVNVVLLRGAHGPKAAALG